MTTTINASTSSGLVVTPDNSGNVLLQYNGVAAPAFAVYRSGGQSFSSGAYTKINFNAEEFDTANYFDTTTNYRFTPLIAGYYQINIAAYFEGSGINNAQLFIRKNGATYKSTVQAGGSMSITDCQLNTQTVIYMNGSTDYLEGYCYVTGSSLSIAGSSSSTYFSGCLLRGA